MQLRARVLQSPDWRPHVFHLWWCLVTSHPASRERLAPELSRQRRPQLVALECSVSMNCTYQPSMRRGFLCGFRLGRYSVKGDVQCHFAATGVRSPWWETRSCLQWLACCCVSEMLTRCGAFKPAFAPTRVWLLFSARIHIGGARLRALACLRSLVLSMKRRMVCRTSRHLWWRVWPCFQSRAPLNAVTSCRHVFRTWATHSRRSPCVGEAAANTVFS